MLRLNFRQPQIVAVVGQDSKTGVSLGRILQNMDQIFKLPLDNRHVDDFLHGASN
jgi:hypothetical protein